MPDERKVFEIGENESGCEHARVGAGAGEGVENQLVEADLGCADEGENGAEEGHCFEGCSG